MDAGLAAGCQTSRVIVDLHREQACSYRLFQVTRRKGETISGRYRRNGYVREQQKTGWLSGRQRWQASSHRGNAGQSDRIKQLVIRLTIAGANNTITPGGLGFVQRLVGIVEP